MFIDNGGVRLHVEVDGNSDGPAVLFLHGITSCMSTWDWLVPQLVETHHVFRLDFRGHGESAWAPDAYGFAEYMSDAIAVCDHVIQRPCVIVGHSLGGATAAALAQHRPDLVTALLLEDPAIMSLDSFTDHALAGMFQLLRQVIPAMQASGTSLEATAEMLRSMPTAGGPLTGEVYQPDGVLAMADGLLHVDATVLPDTGADAPVMSPAFDSHAVIPVPTTVLAADGASLDGVVRQADIDLLATHSPHADVRVIAGAGHMMHDSLAYRDLFVAELRSILAVQPA